MFSRIRLQNYAIDRSFLLEQKTYRIVQPEDLRN